MILVQYSRTRIIRVRSWYGKESWKATTSGQSDHEGGVGDSAVPEGTHSKAPSCKLVLLVQGATGATSMEGPRTIYDGQADAGSGGQVAEFAVEAPTTATGKCDRDPDPISFSPSNAVPSDSQMICGGFGLGGGEGDMGWG